LINTKIKWISTEYIIDVGRLLPTLPEEYKTDDFMVKGCQSKVWLRAYKDGDVMKIQVDSNTAITKGIAALLWRVLSGQKPQDILDADSRLHRAHRTAVASLLSALQWSQCHDRRRVKQYAGTLI
jgi:sulfur transfer protein SufE